MAAENHQAMNQTQSFVTQTGLENRRDMNFHSSCSLFCPLRLKLRFCPWLCPQACVSVSGSSVCNQESQRSPAWQAQEMALLSAACRPRPRGATVWVQPAYIPPVCCFLFRGPSTPVLCSMDEPQACRAEISRRWPAGRVWPSACFCK